MIKDKLYAIHINYENSALDSDNPHICIGWGKMGDLTHIKTKEELEELYNLTYPDAQKMNIAQNVGQIRRFLFETKIGDYVVFGERNIFHIGKITSDYYYDSDVPNQSSDYSNNRNVEWLASFPVKVLSNQARSSLTASLSYFNMDRYIDEFNTLLDGSYLNDNESYAELKKAKDIESNKYDGSFEFIQEIAKAYQKVDLDTLDYKDLELFYFSIIGTWSRSFQNKKRRIRLANLPENEKTRLEELLDNLEKKTLAGFYENSQDEKIKHMGLFGTGVGTLRRVDENAVRTLLEMFIMVSKANDEDECFKIVKDLLPETIKGVKTGILSPILYCLKPTIFPIINGNEGAGIDLYEELGIIIDEPLELYTYLDNSLNVKMFRDEHFIFKNYRVFDLASSKFKTSSKDDLKITKLIISDEGLYTSETGLSVKDWKEILNDDSLIDNETIDLLKEWYKSMNHEASCKKIGEKIYPKELNSSSKIIRKITGPCQKIANKYNIVIEDKNENERYFPIMMNGRYSTYQEGRVFNWILKKEVVQAMGELGLVSIEDVEVEELISYEPYTKANFLEEVFISEDKYEEILQVLKRKKNIILQGSPGVGKTFIADRLAYSIMGERNLNQIEMIQFHQSYSYEDFIFGYQPTDNSFELRPGIFYNFCKKAEQDLENDYFFIIDEINRGNLSKIFGELLMLIENDKRGKHKLTLSHTQEAFTVPKNIFIIGTMNTADRSLAILDYALRRRFSIIDIKPAFNHPGFKKELIKNGTDNQLILKITRNFNKLNKEISEDASLGEGFTIGHSYFCLGKNELNDTTYQEIIRYDIKPILMEYWFDDIEKAEELVKELLW